MSSGVFNNACVSTTGGFSGWLRRGLCLRSGSDDWRSYGLWSGLHGNRLRSSYRVGLIGR